MKTRTTPPALRSLEYWLYQYRRNWRGTLTSGFVNPVLYLAAMGVGLGSLVDKHQAGGGSLGGVTYVSFLAPGLLAAAAMQVGAQESTYPVLGAIKWMRTYLAMLATPLRITDLLIGHLLFILLRVTIAATIFLVVMECFGVGHHPTAVLAIPAAALTGMAFSVPIVAFAATRDGDGSFAAMFRFLIMPMFLFSGTFFPVKQLPHFFRGVAYLTPLWHGVDLCRGFALGTESWARAAMHVGYLLAIVLAAFAVARHTYTNRMAT